MALTNSALLAILCSTLFAGCFAGPTSRILGGNDAGSVDYPYVVSVRLDNAHVCGGSIIAENYILTAAHCISQLGTTPVSSNRISIRAGSVNQYAGGKIYSVSNSFIHNLYGSFLHDIAVLKLATNLELGPNVKIIGIADSSSDIKADEIVQIAGWGRTTSDGTLSFKLQHGESTVISPAECEDSIGYGYNFSLCLGSESGKGACNGDAGGPAVANGKVVGVSNFVIGTCGTKYPDVHSRVSYYNEWINSIVNAS